MEEMEKAPAGWEGVEGGVGPEHNKMVDMTQGWAKFTDKIIAQRSREWTPQELALESKITKLMNKIVSSGSQSLWRRGYQVRLRAAADPWVMQPFHDRKPLILWSLEGPDAVGTARHEAVHFLKMYGYINERNGQF